MIGAFLVILALTLMLGLLARQMRSDAVRATLNAGFMVPNGVADAVREAGLIVLRHTSNSFRYICARAGITGEHAFQRATGLVFMAVVGWPGLAVGVLSCAQAFSGIFAGSRGGWLDTLAFEHLLAFEMAASALLAATIIFDLVGFTNFCHCYSNLSSPTRRAVGVASGLVLIGSVVCIMVAGVLRGKALFTTEENLSSLEGMATTLLIIVPLLGLVAGVLVGPMLIQSMTLISAAVLGLCVASIAASLWCAARLVNELCNLLYRLALVLLGAVDQTRTPQVAGTTVAGARIPPSVDPPSQPTPVGLPLAADPTPKQQPKNSVPADPAAVLSSFGLAAPGTTPTAANRDSSHLEASPLEPDPNWQPSFGGKPSRDNGNVTPTTNQQMNRS